MDTTNQKAVTPSKSTQLRTNKVISCLSAGLLFIYSCNDTALWRYIWASRHINTIIAPPQDFRNPVVCLPCQYVLWLKSVAGSGWDALCPGLPHNAMWVWHSRGWRSSCAKSTPHSCFCEPQTFPEPILLHGKSEYPAESGPRHQGEPSSVQVERGLSNNDSGDVTATPARILPCSFLRPRLIHSDHFYIF